ncbi:LOW QUALITY PROTEIN: two component system response regulator, partial [Streptomyces sp. C]
DPDPDRRRRTHGPRGRPRGPRHRSGHHRGRGGRRRPAGGGTRALPPPARGGPRHPDAPEPAVWKPPPRYAGPSPGRGVVMLTTFGEDEYILRALGEGAAGFLIKSGEPEELIAGVRAVADGAAYLSPKVAARVVAHLAAGGAGAAAARRSAARAKVEALTGREREVLGYLGSGFSNGQVARRLGLAEGTVKAHVSSILARLGVDNRAAAA